jgi:hypothetical protein
LRKIENKGTKIEQKKKQEANFKKKNVPTPFGLSFL